jgi:hypothetical protein
MTSETSSARLDLHTHPQVANYDPPPETAHEHMLALEAQYQGLQLLVGELLRKNEALRLKLALLEGAVA